MSIYEQALDAIKNNKVNVTLYAGGRKRVYLSQTNGGANLIYQELDERNLVRKTEQVRCGFFSPRRGWIFSLDWDRYLGWVERAGGKVAQSNLTRSAR